jgi:Protein of unknown function (DUF3050)
LATQSVISPIVDTGVRSEQIVSFTGESYVNNRVYLEELQKRIAPLREALLSHSIYNEIDSVERLRQFMQMHVFAVWDFMSLVKRLQNEVTCRSLPWLPPTSAQVARFANEVVLGEESDLGPDGKPVSHFELYLKAMDEIGANTTVVKRFIHKVARGERWEAALMGLRVPAGVYEFVNETMRCAINGSTVEVASYFLFGREDVIPEMFKRLLSLWGNGGVEVPSFAYYLERHIELDGESHGPWAEQMLMTLAGQNERSWRQAAYAAERAITNRIQLWDSVLLHLKSR